MVGISPYELPDVALTILRLRRIRRVGIGFCIFSMSSCNNHELNSHTLGNRLLDGNHPPRAMNPCPSILQASFTRIKSVKS